MFEGKARRLLSFWTTARCSNWADPESTHKCYTGLKEVKNNTSVSSTVVEHPTHKPKVEGSVTGQQERENDEKIFCNKRSSLLSLQGPLL
jgi:hypothetical protein